MDNRIFNINGRGKDLLISVIKLATEQCNHGKTKKIAGWILDNEKGLILLSYITDKSGNQPFITPLEYNIVGEMVWEWLQSPDAKNIPTLGNDSDYQHDGDNYLGWRAYVEAWSHSNVIVAIKPAYLWYGK